MARERRRYRKGEREKEREREEGRREDLKTVACKREGGSKK